MKAVNTCAMSLNYNSHICLEFYRGEKWSEYLAFEPTGPKKFRELTSKMEKEFYRASATSPEDAALSFLRAAQGAYLPGDGVTEILLEIYTMSKTNGSGNLKDLNTAQLMDAYNKLAKAVNRSELKAWKESKSKLIAKLEALQIDVAKPTRKQADAKKQASEAAVKRLAGMADKPKAEKAAPEPRTSPSASPGAKGKASKSQPAAKRSKPASAAPAKGPKKTGIGAFCIELIKKGKSNEEVLAAVKKEFPQAATSASSVAWYRNKLKSEG